MKTSLIMATLVVVGAGAVGAGAVTFVPSPYKGSDTEYDLTNGAIAASLLGTSGDYIGGGSGNGENAMTAATPAQRTAPMSKMMTKQTCAVAGGAAAFSHASGIALGLDAVDVYSYALAGGDATCNGAAGVGGDSTGFGLRYSGTNGADGGPYLNWTDMLALLYGGMDKSSSFCAGGTAAGQACNPQTVPQSGTACVIGGGTCTPLTDCASAKRVALVNNWKNLFQSATCDNNVRVCNAILPAIQGELAGGQTAMGKKLWHAFRLDDNSGTADVFASLLGLGQLTDTSGVKTIMANVSSSANKGFGASPYCNVINWDNTAANANCGLGANHQFVGPGGIPDPAAGDVIHRRPPSYCKDGTACVPNGPACADGTFCNGVWGANPDSSQLKNNDTAAAFPTSFQDNDPIRRPCISKNSFVGKSAFPAEEVCNLDGKLGVVLPIPPVDFIPRAFPTGGNGGAARTVYNTNGTQTFTSVATFAVYKCTQSATPTFGAMCPNGDHVGGACAAPADQNTSPPFAATPCQTPTGDACTTLAEADPLTSWPPGSLQAQDARIFNLFNFDGGGGYTLQTVPAAGASFAFSGAFARLHQTHPMWDPTAPNNCGVNADCPATAPVCYHGNGVAGSNTGICAGSACQQGDATDQIGCLVQADPCSVAFAGNTGFTWGSRALPAVASNNERMRINQIYPTNTTVRNGSYLFWRKIYFNASAGFDQAALANTDELALAQYESNPDTITGLLGTYGFFGFGASPNASNFAGTNAGNAPFCEDFNEQLIGANGGTNACNGVASNTNACNFNTTLEAPSANMAMPSATLPHASPVPSDPSPNPATPTTSSVCGNGHVESFEDCDHGLNNGTAGDTCSLTCRTVFL